MKKVIKGLRRDISGIDQPEGTWPDARNISVFKKLSSISNEYGLKDITYCDNTISHCYPNSKKNIGVIPTNGRKVLFFVDPNNLFSSEIGIIDENEVYTLFLKDSINSRVLNFDINHPIKGRFTYKFNDNLIITWTDNFNEPRILNIDCPPFEIDQSFFVVSPSDVNKAKALIKMFPDAIAPNITDISVNDNGGSILTGTWYPIISYGLSDGTETSWLTVFNGIPIVIDSRNLSFNQYDGDESGLTTSKSISLTFSDIDTNYTFIRLGFIYLSKGQYTAYYINRYRITNSTTQILFSGGETTMEQIDLTNVLVPNVVYPKVKTLTDLQSILYLGNVEVETDPNYQPYANNINVEWIRGDEIDLKNDISNSYKDGKIVFFDKSFKSNEVIALYIVLERTSGTKTSAFHIPGRDALSNERDVVSGLGNQEIDALGNNVKRFQIFETALPSGEMGFWENETELYPDTSEFDSTSLGGQDLRGQRVRHHKIPEARFFIENGEGFFTSFQTDATLLATYNGTTRFDMNTIWSADFSQTSNNTGYTWTLVPGITYDSHTVTGITTNVGIIVTFNISINIVGGSPNDIVNLQAFDQGIPAATIAIDVPITLDSIGSFTGNFTGQYTFQVQNGQILDLAVIVTNPSNLSSFSTITFPGSTIQVDRQNIYNRSKPIGLRISNVNIPSSIQSSISGWSIYYAKRTSGNIRIIGQDIPKLDRFHCFDLMATQSSLRATYVKQQITFVPPTIQDFDSLTNVLETINPEDINAVQDWFYVGENTLVPVNNTNRSSSIFATGIYTAFYLNTNTLYDLCIYKQDTYVSFQDQDLIYTGTTFRVTSSGIQPTQEVFGGDVYINQYGFLEDTVNFYEYLIGCESALNIGLRIEDVVNNKYYYPKYTNASTPQPTISYYGYNNDYTSINDLNKVFPKRFSDNDCSDNVFKFPQKIPRSNNDGNETTILGWRTFKANAYYEMPKNKGSIWNLEGIDRTIFIQLEYTLYIGEIKDRLASGTEEIALGISQLFDRPPIEVVPTNEGFIGSRSMFASLITPMGYCVVDRDKGKVFIVRSPQSFDEISAEGLSQFWSERAQTSQDVDNPFNGNGYTMVFDYDDERILITKKDSIDSFTLSFSRITKSWICWHDYMPEYMFSNRKGHYLIDNINKKIYLGNDSTKVGKYFNGDIYDSYIDICFNESPDLSKTYNSCSWISEVRDFQDVFKKDKTLTHIIVYNDYQCSGLISLTKNNSTLWYNQNRRNVEQEWHFNDFRDLVDNLNNAFLDVNNQVITSNINSNKPWYKKNKFVSKYIVVRLIYDNMDQNNIYLNASNFKSRISGR